MSTTRRTLADEEARGSLRWDFGAVGSRGVNETQLPYGGYEGLEAESAPVRVRLPDILLWRAAADGGLDPPNDRPEDARREKS